MRVLFICHEYPPKPFGGIGSFTKLMAEQLTEQGVTVGVIGYGQENKNIVLDEDGVSVYRIAPPIPSGNKYLNILKQFTNRLKFYRELKKYVRSFCPDIIESYDWSGPLLFKINEVKLVVRLHGSNTANNDYMNKKRSALLIFFEKRALKMADVIVSVSSHVALQTKESFKIDFPYTTIYNGVDLDKFKNTNTQRNLSKILFVGRMHDYKGFKELFNAMNQVFESNSEVHFDIVCTIIEAYKENLLKRVDEKYHDRIHFIGRVENHLLPDKYNEANLSILPSLTEAFPIIPLESMACGTPVIMSNRFSSKEIIDDGENGFLVNVLDPKELATGILNALSNQIKIDEMRDKVHLKIATNFGIEQILQENIKLYQSIIYK